MNKTAVRVAILIRTMFQVRLQDSPGMADYIAKVQTIHGELKELGIVFPEQASAAALLIDLTPAYEVTRKMLLTLSAKDLTFTKVSLHSSPPRKTPRLKPRPTPSVLPCLKQVSPR
ncbi:unnamed protein product [Closterium sp. NIES-53]